MHSHEISRAQHTNNVTYENTFYQNRVAYSLSIFIGLAGLSVCCFYSVSLLRLVSISRPNRYAVCTSRTNTLTHVALQSSTHSIRAINRRSTPTHSNETRARYMCGVHNTCGAPVSNGRRYLFHASEHTGHWFVASLVWRCTRHDPACCA